MREINGRFKFRAWDKNRKVMVEVAGWNSKKVVEPSGLWTPTEDCNLLQYTGLKDRNGVEIYEGDWLWRKMGRGDNYDTFLCEFKDGAYRYGSNEKYARDTVIGDKPDCEVIGNIWENPDLLREGKDSE